MIKPNQHLPDGDRKHRSDVILEDELLDERGKHSMAGMTMHDIVSPST
jgi:hypothetical protein